MKGMWIGILVLTTIILAEYYTFQAIKLVFPAPDGARWSTAVWVYLVINIASYALFFSYRIWGIKGYIPVIYAYSATTFMMMAVAKLVIGLFLLCGDVYHCCAWVMSRMGNTPAVSGGGMTRSSFLSKLALGTAAIPFFGLLYGVVVNAYNYQIRRVSLKFPNLPEAFDGFKIVQLSDIHSGSFNRTQPLIDAVKTINDLQADLILFTGDLVNNKTSEMIPYMDIFSKLTAKHGVLSVTGNHDYGDYVPWDSKEAKAANFQRLVETHGELGWDILMNEHRLIARDGQKIAIIGIENWGHALNFPRYGKLDVAHKGTEEIPFKLLMSHDPSHWDAQVRKEYPDIDLTLSGHTHGFQFGIENKYIKWSPSQWVYKQWGGLYQEGKQFIYVNRGFGFLGYPGRVGILPEITEITLKKG
jgi:uncharacterized protein